MKTMTQVMREESARYWESDEARRAALDPRSSTGMPVRVVTLSRELSRHHYFRFVAGVVDDHSIAGWVTVMNGRQQLIKETARKVGKDKA